MWIIVQGFAVALLVVLVVLIIILGLSFLEANRWIWSVSLLLMLSTLNALVTLPILVNSIIWLIIIGLLAIVLIPRLRHRWITRYLYKICQKIMPSISHTEQEAIDAGDVWWEGRLFQGRPDWDALLKFPKSSLTLEETEFLNCQVDTLCSLLDEWVITHHTLDLPLEAWDYLKKERFFGIKIPKQYGGLGFTALGCSTIVQKICTRSLTTAVTMMVPNALGPGELLLAYGTDEQKNYYLPRLAIGQEIPCFALTGLEAGSDAGSIPDIGIVCKGELNGQEVLGMRLTWDKRYITLAPVATVLGLAFKLKDPEGLLGNKKDLGITLCLLPTDHPGVEIGKRHFPLNQPFMNGPTRGRDVFVPLDWIIGGPAMIGRGWRMLVECLSAGRGISLPALSTAAAKHCYRVTGAYAELRKQFNTSIGHFEGVEEAMARIAGRTYGLEATRLFTTMAIDQGIKPAVASAIVKYHMTEAARSCANDAMDIHGGRGIMLGPKNYLGRGYESVPISITVEGANILTRSLIIFGQGAIRCHPYLRKEMQALHLHNIDEGIKLFESYFFKHLQYTLSNFSRLVVHSLTNGFFCKVPVITVVDKDSVGPCPQGLRRAFRQLTRMSIALSFVSDVALVIMGGKLKRRERLSARLGDVLSYLYMSSAVIKYSHDFGDQKQDIIHVQWFIQTALHRIQEAFTDFLNNFKPSLLSKLLRFLIFPYGASYLKPSDALEHQMALLMTTPSDFRERLTTHCYLGTIENSEVARLESAFQVFSKLEPLFAKLEQAYKTHPVFQGIKNMKDLDKDLKMKMAFEAGILTLDEVKQIHSFEQARVKIMQVDEFTNAELRGE